MFGIWKPTERPIKLQCRIKSEIEHLLPALVVFFGTIGVVSFLVWKLGLADFLKYAAFAIAILAGLLIVAAIIAIVGGFLLKNTIGRLWDITCEKRGIRGYDKKKTELAIGEAAMVGIFALMLLCFLMLIVLAVLKDGIWTLVEALVVTVVGTGIVIAAVVIAIIAYKVIGWLWEKFWVTMGCPTKAEKEALKRKWEDEKWFARRKELIRQAEEAERKRREGGI